MNDDYLWDKTGQPDPQIQQLEEILGTLRYQPKPLAIPDDYAAATKELLPLGGDCGIGAARDTLPEASGLRVRSRNDAPPQQVRIESPTPKPEVTPVLPEKKSAVNPSPVVATNRRRNRSASSAVKHKEALMAKEQLMLALRVTSQKLHMVHTKTSPANQIKNQHRVG